jgi:hypothetical protein
LALMLFIYFWKSCSLGTLKFDIVEFFPVLYISWKILVYILACNHSSFCPSFWSACYSIFEFLTNFGFMVVIYV